MNIKVSLVQTIIYVTEMAEENNKIPYKECFVLL